MSNDDAEYVSRAGLKLEHALREFRIDGTGLVCADFGCNVGGFTDCLLQHGAKMVYAIDTGYGVLDWKLRNDPRVVVMERTNALHAARPQPAEAIDLVVIDLGWTPQRFAIPAAIRWLEPVLPQSQGRGQRVGGSTEDVATPKPRQSLNRSPARSVTGGAKPIITLIKPHYELTNDERRELLRDGVLAADEAQRVCNRVLNELSALDVEVVSVTRSPLTGGKSGSNIEFLALLRTCFEDAV